MLDAKSHVEAAKRPHIAGLVYGYEVPSKIMKTTECRTPRIHHTGKVARHGTTKTLSGANPVIVSALNRTAKGIHEAQNNLCK